MGQRQINLFKNDEPMDVSVTCGSDVNKVVSAGGASSGGVYVWDLATGRMSNIREISRRVLEDTRVAINPSASLIASATTHASAEIVDLSSGLTSKILGSRTGSSGDVAF